ncbi:arginyl-tRNA synthetase [Filimonas lacunae]|uniref:Arginine--tRNA ligase n=1 Tax=Filimonas lacunae TaxID=477680 RepID=A0A173MKA2_9BACT|nr:arginine--tRNA ligase [Filimonas lacunae]BAV08072.1 arginyl-tRNA synthetase [Filimonas lacunae]SIT08869.1 arginyl-tRNA synthetase [Filimonas lacunae]
MSIVAQIKQVAAAALKELYQQDIAEQDITINATKPEFTGDYTIVLFGFVKQLRKSPDELGEQLGALLVKNHPDLFSSFNVIKGFLNLEVSTPWWVNFLEQQYKNPAYGTQPANGSKVMVEYSSPNTNKPLHLGHLRNNFLGWSIAAILEANGHEVVKTCVVNDRGIHICKSMIAWQLFANGATPESTGKKGDHFVGDYYVKFSNELKVQSKVLTDAIAQGDVSAFTSEEQAKIATHQAKVAQLTGILENLPADQVAKKAPSLKDKIATEQEEIKDIAENATPIMKATKQMLLDWENGVPEVIALWKTMNSWVYDGFNTTYQRIGSDFQKTYYESNTYLLGKDLVEEGLAKGVFFQKEDSSVWIDLTADGLDEKLVRRKDGTSVYITQDIGLAELKQKEYGAEQSIYVVGDEQNYHFKVLKLICQKLGLPSADGIYHLSYGMVELPSGKMKSREGTVVDADDLVKEMTSTAYDTTKEKLTEIGSIQNYSEEELTTLCDTIGIGALKFFLLRVDPKKKMIFNPEESIDAHGFTGPFIQYAYVRIKSIIRKFGEAAGNSSIATELTPLEKALIIQLELYPGVIAEAAAEHDPSKIAVFAFNLAQAFGTFYNDKGHSIGNAENEEKKELRLKLAQLTAQTLSKAMGLLGIQVPERM